MINTNNKINQFKLDYKLTLHENMSAFCYEHFENKKDFLNKANISEATFNNIKHKKPSYKIYGRLAMVTGCRVLDLVKLRIKTNK